MEADDYKKLKEVFQSAVEVSGEERSRLLDEKCAGDAALRAAIEKLLASNDTEFLETPAAGNLVGSLGGKPSSSSISGQRIGHYNVERKIGSGGMGDVYLAVDGKLGRRVAIKILPEEFTLDEDRLDRFQLEARAASALSHPNILTIHEIGEWEGTHYIATEYVEGETLRHRLTREPLSVAETIEFGVQLVSAIAAAHEAGICHRDIKPENIMVRRDGIVKVVDFGLAKLNGSPFRADSSSTADDPTVKIVRTEPGVIMGTVQYMSPEQTRGLPTDERSDIWSLGCVLYEMLAGHAPFTGDSSADLIAEIVKTHPIPLASVNDEVPERLDEIVAKALEKNPDERYQSAKDLLIDLKRLKRRFDVDTELERSNPRITNTASDEVVISGPNIISTKKGPKDLTEVNSAEYLYWGMKAHRWTAIGITLFVIGLVGGTAMLVRYYWRATDPNEARLEYFNKVKLAAQALDASNFEYAHGLLEEMVPAVGEPDLRDFEWGYLSALYAERTATPPMIIPRESMVDSVAFSSDGKMFASAEGSGTVKLYDAASGNEIRSFVGHTQLVTHVEFTPDHNSLLTNSFDGTTRLWDLETAAQLVKISAEGGIGWPTVYDGLTISGTADGSIRLWDSSTGQYRSEFLKLTPGDNAIQFSGDRRLLAIRHRDFSISVYQLPGIRLLSSIPAGPSAITAFTFTPFGVMLATAHADGSLKMRRAVDGSEVWSAGGHAEEIREIVFTRDGRLIATGGSDDSVKLWNAEKGFEIATLKGHRGDVQALAFSPDGLKLLSGGADDSIRLWNVPQTPSRGVLRGHRASVTNVEFSPSGKLVGTTSEDGTAKIWDAETEADRLTLVGHSATVHAIAFSSDSKTVATSGADKKLKIWDGITGRVQTSIPLPESAGAISFSPDTKRIATGHWWDDPSIRIWDTSTGREICRTDPHPKAGAWSVEFVKDRNELISSGDNRVIRWDSTTCKEISRFESDLGSSLVSRYSQVGRPWTLQLLNNSRSAKLLDTDSRKELASFAGHDTEMTDFDFTPDGKRLLTSDGLGTVKIWDVVTSQEILSFKANVGKISQTAFTPNGKVLAIAGSNGNVRLFRSNLAQR
jgi:WD40 repeat protein/serine/threonine protein kinase